jgi:phospholipase C
MKSEMKFCATRNGWTRRGARTAGLLGALLLASACSDSGADGASAADAFSRGHGDSAPFAKIQHVVVIYLENHSFDNLYGALPGVEGRAQAAPENTTQVDETGAPYRELAFAQADALHFQSPAT